ncbi:hypothetical protein DYB37_001984 [Aphanomyces astaci]|uniref:Uncharacterized protein n=1 Tax=Aphanomyces astaci TaxID=112090 RepID=A0A3R7AMU6_APHAT|nr:hypothetical protein DYB35_001421 [Aphanomyces astaci]RHZ26764.1 hypothetical protein DYB37_001984 [Aphanomyces astaci]
MMHAACLVGAIFYGHGMRKAFCKFVQDNSTSASMAHCQHMRQFGVTITEQCVWIHAQPDEASRVVYQTLYQWEVAWFLWAKLILRCVLTGYVVWEMRLHYYDHCVALVRALETYGMPDPLSPLHHIEVYIGDPTCLILGNPLVSLCFVIDFWMSVTSVGEVMLQLSQLDDLGYFLSGSMEFNDFNQRMVLSILQPSCINLVRSRGGSVYVLYDISATFQNMPLFRHRSADCFVVGYDATSTPIEHLRLSLLQCVDLSRNGRSSISVCGMTHDAAVCILNTKPCLATSPIATLRIHPGANSSKWLL